MKGVNYRMICFILGLLPLSAISPGPGNRSLGSESAEAHRLYALLPHGELTYEAFLMAYSGFRKICRTNRGINDSLLTIADYTQPSVNKRLYVMDTKNCKLLVNCLVAHGKNSGSLYAHQFSNTSRSHMSSLGFYLTGQTYSGKHGYSLRLHGIERGLNDNAFSRAIVIHGANYVSEAFIEKYGRLGRSYGCPALPKELSREIIDLIKEKTCMFIYYPDETYTASSEYAISASSFQAFR